MRSLFLWGHYNDQADQQLRLLLITGTNDEVPRTL